jgi:UDP-N-acetylglucosamine--N-acetylmuramyl-(pentapeptide) pyrophosphoryl-undecaprenol N-acetylglucosamine transferase
VLHESDALPGRENRMLAPLAHSVCVGFPHAERRLHGRTIVTGNLTRPHFAGGDIVRCRERFGLAPDRPLIFVTGGSQGALTLNELLAPIVPALTGRWSVIHQCGRGKLPASGRIEHYAPVEFLGDELADVYAATTLLVGRAGAATIAEAAAYRVPAVFVPLPVGRRASGPERKADRVRGHV